MLEKVNINYDIRISDDKSYVIVKIKQDISAQTALDLTKDSVDIAGKYGINCFLFDLHNIYNTWRIWENYQFAQDLGNYGMVLL